MLPAKGVDSDHQQMLSNSPGSSGSQNLGVGTQVVELQGILSQLVQVEVTVLRAYNIPHIKNKIGQKRRSYVTVTNLGTVKKTESVRVDGQTAQWNQKLGVFSTQRSSHLILCLFVKRLTRSDAVVGTCEIPIPVASQSDIPVVLSNGDRDAGPSTPPITLYLTITVSTNVPPPSPNIPINIPNHFPETPTKEDGPPAEESTNPSIVPDSEGPFQSTPTEPLIPSSNTLPIETGTPMPDDQAEMSHADKALISLRLADEAKKAIGRKNTWEGAIGRIKWVMDTVSPIAELHPFAKMAHGMISAIPETLLEQYQRDGNVLKLLEAMHDAFDFAHHEETLKYIKPDSRQAQILTVMLQDVCSCSDFIQSYAKDSQFWKRTLKHTTSGATKEIEDLSTALVDHRRAFLDQGIIATEITAFQILDGVGIISAKVDGISTHLEWVSNQVSDAELDRKIGEIPYGTGSRFSPDKGCLMGTRTAFLDFIVDWVNDPTSERGLVLFGQAGTGKSSIAHEIARRFDKLHRLTSSFIFLRKEQSKRDAYHLFTTLARDLSDRYPSFKTALGKIVKDNTSLRVGTRDYGTLFESLILEPLKNLHIVGPILVVIDALDESGDVTRGDGLHKFLAKNLSRLPPNFRVFITSRPEDAIQSAFVGALSIRTNSMDDLDLAAETRGDIFTFIRMKLDSDELNIYCDALATKAEGLFQWAAVACGYILRPLESFDFSRTKCIKHLLKPTADHRRPDPLDDLYEEVLTGYFRNQEAQRLFRSVMGQLIAALEPLSIRSLIALRCHTSIDASVDDNSDAESVRGVLGRLGSLLSNVNSADENLPIVPLHTSFRDFLTNKKKSGDFYINLRDSHRHLAHSCLGLAHHELKFNICNLESSYLANTGVPDLKSRISKHVPPTLLYACRFWGDHLEDVAFEADLFDKLQVFFGAKFLFWLEALSLTRNMRLALPALSFLSAWLVSGQGVSETKLEELRAFIDDASAFVRYFGIAMAKSAPHVYLSTLPFAPSRSLVHARYSGSFPRMLRVGRGRLSQWPSSQMVISNVGNKTDLFLSIALSPDGQRIVSGSGNEIRVWNATTGETETGPLTSHWGSIRSVAFSPDGQRIVSGSGGGAIRVWNATTGEAEAGSFYKHKYAVRSLAFSPDGRRIVSGSEEIYVWNATTGETEAGPFTAHNSSAFSVAISPDGQRIVSGWNDGSIRVWNATTGEIEASLFPGHTGLVNSVAFSPDGQRVVSGSADRTIRVWNSTTGETEAGPLTGCMSSVESVAFSPDGRRIVSGSGNEIHVWDATTGEKVVGPYTGHTGPVTSVAFFPDGRRIVSSSYDRTIRVWDATTRDTEADTYTGHTSSVSFVAFSSDGRRIISGSDDRTIRVWNGTTGETETAPSTRHMDSVRDQDQVLSVAFSPDGQRIVKSWYDGMTCMWNTTTGEKEADLLTPNWAEHFQVWSVVFSPDGQRIALGLNDGTIHVLNATTRNIFQSYKENVSIRDPILSVAFSPDGQRIVSDCGDTMIRVWNTITQVTTTGRIVETQFTRYAGNPVQVSSVAFSPDGRRIVSGSGDGTIRVWNATTVETEAGPFMGNTSSVSFVAFSPDGQRIVSGSGDGTIRVWNATTGETEAGPFAGHTSSVISMAFSPDGQRIVSGSRDRSIRVWDAWWNVTAGKTTTSPLIGHTDSVESMAFSPDGDMETTRRDMKGFQKNKKRCITDQTVIDKEGWICGSKGELMMWIPPLHRTCLHRPSNIWVGGEYDIYIDLSNFVHGRSWATCINT